MMLGHNNPPASITIEKLQSNKEMIAAKSAELKVAKSHSKQLTKEKNRLQALDNIDIAVYYAENIDPLPKLEKAAEIQKLVDLHQANERNIRKKKEDGDWLKTFHGRKMKCDREITFEQLLELSQSKREKMRKEDNPREPEQPKAEVTELPTETVPKKDYDALKKEHDDLKRVFKEKSVGILNKIKENQVLLNTIKSCADKGDLEGIKELLD